MGEERKKGKWSRIWWTISRWGRWKELGNSGAEGVKGKVCTGVGKRCRCDWAITCQIYPSQSMPSLAFIQTFSARDRSSLHLSTKLKVGTMFINSASVSFWMACLQTLMVDYSNTFELSLLMLVRALTLILGPFPNIGFALIFLAANNEC